jgi:hypothetical protein
VDLELDEGVRDIASACMSIDVTRELGYKRSDLRGVLLQRLDDGVLRARGV